ncbi:MAG: SusF/SusE family outer membrane protein [Ferruginibacter sp.]|nr:SusF/SusE family outer membrane protein [Ferruginibacter sp.]
MKHIFKITSYLFAVALILSACNKVGDLPFYQSGKASQLTATATTVAPEPKDSLTEVITFNWTFPAYSIEEAKTKYILQIDSAGRNFSKAESMEFTGTLNKTFLAKDLNALLLKLGLSFGVEYGVEARIISSYPNNNERLTSNTVTFKATPYKVPPKIPVPAALYLVGTINGWNNSSSLETKYQFSQIGETTFAGIFNFQDGGAYKLIQELGNWSTQYHMIDGGGPLSGQFEQKDAEPGFPEPFVPGWYRVTVDFQNATYTVAPSSARGETPANLYIVGNLNGWNNSSSLDPKYTFTKENPFVYTLDVDFTEGGIYKLIQELGIWSTQFHRTTGDALFGEFEQADSDPAFLNPETPGKYRIRVDFAANYYWLTKL